ncbi:hypothetical protein EII34_09230 [Arachnia propionica]|uniref:Uncharacterized protein n=1 Tax=Arachnia propionica TaxID=1750 RepID=A0A3P1T8F0_9ACTN|nr:hypothetical protein [Arachnia propionica]RRD04713.1 hypothetical protein EII34_09230 [Arachnia propionica]
MAEFDSPGSGRPRRGLPEVAEEDDSPTLVNMPVPRRSALTPSSPGTPLSPFPDPVPRRSALTPASPTTAAPVPRRSALTPSSPGRWHAVGRDDDDAKPPLPVWVKSTAIGVLVVIVVVAGWLVFNLASPTPPSPSTSPSDSATSSGPWELRLVKQVGEYVAGDPIVGDGSVTGDAELLSADYSDGTSKFRLQLYRPETDMTAYLKTAGVVEPVEVGNAMCGTLEGNGLPMCVRVVDDTAIAVAGLSEQTPEALSALVDEFYARLSGK